jgi:hypothetical protein
MAPAEGAREDALQARAGGGGLAAPLALARTLLGVLYRRRAGCEQAHTCQPVGRYGSLRGARPGWNRNSLFLGRITCSRPIACAAIALGAMLQCMMAPSAHLCAAENHRARGGHLLALSAAGKQLWRESKGGRCLARWTTMELKLP